MMSTGRDRSRPRGHGGSRLKLSCSDRNAAAGRPALIWRRRWAMRGTDPRTRKALMRDLRVEKGAGADEREKAKQYKQIT